MPVIAIQTEHDFKQQISSDKLVVVDFYATWCGPCRFVAPKIEEFSTKYTNVVFIKVDVDQLASVAAECEISAMPTFQLFKAGKKVAEVIGADANKIEAAIKKHL